MRSAPRVPLGVFKKATKRCLVEAGLNTPGITLEALYLILKICDGDEITGIRTDNGVSMTVVCPD